MKELAIILIFLATKLAVAFRPRAIEDFICFGKPTDTLVPHPEECNSYFMCDGGVASKKSCPVGIFYNPIMTKCDPNYKDCNSPSGSETTASNSTSTNGFGTEGTTTVSYPWSSGSSETLTTVTPRPDATPKACPSVDTPHLTFLPSTEYCEQFYLCYYGKPILFDCSGGYYWSQEKKGCVLPKQSDCQIPSPNSPFSPRCPIKGQLFYPHPRNCGNFYYCENGVKSVQRCQAFYHWDVQEKRCILKTRAICIKTIPMPLRRSFYN